MTIDERLRDQRADALSFVDRLGSGTPTPPSAPQPAAATLAIGCACWEKRDGDNLRGGRVYDVSADEDGETVLHVVEARRGGLLVERLKASEIDPASVQPVSRAKVHTMVRHVLRCIAERKGQWNGTDEFELGIAERLMAAVRQ